MLEAAWWGFVGGSALLLGAVVGVYVPVSSRTVGLVMGFGTGVLVSALAFDLVAESHAEAGLPWTLAGLLAGSVAFYAGNTWLETRGGHGRKSMTGQDGSTAASALALGALLDGVPESAAIGVTLVGGGSVGTTVVVAVFLSNLPEAVSASAGMRECGRSVRTILTLWVGIAAAATLSAALGFAVLGGGSAGVAGVAQAFAAGAILTMLVDTMVPEAVRHAGRSVGLVTALGFAVAFWVAHA